jgi:hypothetical protein
MAPQVPVDDWKKVKCLSLKTDGILRRDFANGLGVIYVQCFTVYMPDIPSQ